MVKKRQQKGVGSKGIQCEIVKSEVENERNRLVEEVERLKAYIKNFEFIAELNLEYLGLQLQPGAVQRSRLDP